MIPFGLFVSAISLTSLSYRLCDALLIKDRSLSFVLHPLPPAVPIGVRFGVATRDHFKGTSPSSVYAGTLDTVPTEGSEQAPSTPTTLKMSETAASSQVTSADETKVPVYLKAYDLSHGLVSTIAVPLLGFPLEAVWHTSIAIFGNEYLFGDGISYAEEERCERNTKAKLIRKVLLGHTNITRDVFHEYIESIREQFSPESYNLLRWNCNNFTNVVAEFLTGKGIPEDYVKFVEKISQSPNGQMMLNIVGEARERDRNAFVVPGQRT